MVERVWLTWEIQRRNRTLSSKLNANLYEITANGPRWKRYPFQIFRTLKILSRTKPSFIFSQNPSLLLTALAVVYGKISNSTIIVDAHNSGIFPIEGKSYLLNRIAEILNSYSDKVIVSNSALIKFIKKKRMTSLRYRTLYRLSPSIQNSLYRKTSLTLFLYAAGQLTNHSRRC